jgi:hypothetical protein
MIESVARIRWMNNGYRQDRFARERPHRPATSSLDNKGGRLGVADRGGTLRKLGEDLSEVRMSIGIRGIRRVLAGLPIIAMTTLGCQLGPGRLQVASFHYSDAVRIAQAEELLVNLVRLRYRDGPLFLSVTSISTQFEFNAGLGVGGSSSWSPGSNSVGADAGLSYAEKPTISFSIMGGEKFQEKILKPLEVADISLLVQSGWRGDRVLQLTVENLNGLRNAPRASGPTPDVEPEYQRFLEATRLLSQLAEEGHLYFDFESRREPLSAPISPSQVDGSSTLDAVEAGAVWKVNEEGAVQLFSVNRTLVMRITRSSVGLAEVARLRELLSLDPNRIRYDVVEQEMSDCDPFEPEKRLTKLEIDARSLMGVLYYVSHGVEVSQHDRESGIVTSTIDSDGDPYEWSDLLGGLLKVRLAEGRRRPADAVVAVRHRNRWFYIDDSDLTSKSTFLLLGQLFALQAGEVDDDKPVLTLPVGG